MGAGVEIFYFRKGSQGGLSEEGTLMPRFAEGEEARHPKISQGPKNSDLVLRYPKVWGVFWG